MFENNTKGKTSCCIGATVFILCFIAAHSSFYWVDDASNWYLSSFINHLTLPVGYLNGLFSNHNEVLGPTMHATSTLHVIEREAVFIFFTIGLILSFISLYFTLKAVENNEFTFWYANGAFTSTTALFLLNVYVGITYMLLTLILVTMKRKYRI